MEMYRLYIKERENLDMIETEKGFIVYRIEKNLNCLISDYFVKKEFRQDGHGIFLANQVFQICKDAGVKTVFCTTDDRAAGVEVSKIAIERFGFEIVSQSGPKITYKMEVSEWENS